MVCKRKGRCSKMKASINSSKMNVRFSNSNMKTSISNVQRIPSANDYEKALNKPSIEGVTLVNDKTFEDLGLSEVGNTELKEMFDKIFN